MGFALITGGSQGIGAALAEEFARKNIPLILVARSEQKLKDLSDNLAKKYQIEVKYLVLDLSITNASQQIFQFVIENKIEVTYLVNNAGYGISGRLLEHPLSQHINLIHLNINTLVELTYLFIDYFLKKQTTSYIINIASTSAYQAVPGFSTYSASKAFVLSFTRGLALEYQKTPLVFKASCPGGTETEFSSRAEINNPQALKLQKKFNMTPQDVAKDLINNLNNKKVEITHGFLNKVHSIVCRIVPKKWVESPAIKIYIK